MPLIKNNQLMEDNWVRWDGDSPITGDVIVSLGVWNEHKPQLMAHDGAVGIQLASDQAPDLIQQDLAHLDLVALEFPAFKDGRAFSYARLLRERFGFAGEVRAVGDVLRDQAFFMLRCGFDAFEVADATALNGFLDALGEFTFVYQPSTDNRRSVVANRHATSVAAE